MDWKLSIFKVHALGNSSCPVGERGQPSQPDHRRRLVLHNKSPMWNEASQVYQLDFGGRVTQESAKNFQVEYKGQQVRTFSVKTYKLWTLLCKNLGDKTTSEVARIETYFFIFTITFYSHFSSIQVMQFGRIDNNAYTLDFQYPFTAVQAFAVALANVTQRLKWTKKLKLPT